MVFQTIRMRWGSQAYAQDGIVQRALEKAKEEFKKDMYLITDVCMCEYTSHGHCGVLCGQEVEMTLHWNCWQKTALSHVQAGADMVAPSDEMGWTCACNTDTFG